MWALFVGAACLMLLVAVIAVLLAASCARARQQVAVEREGVVLQGTTGLPKH